MKLRTCSAAVVAIVLTTSAWADDVALDAANSMKCPGEEFVVQLCDSDLTNIEQTAAFVPELPSEADRIAAIVDKIAQSTVLIGVLSPWSGDELSSAAYDLGSDPSETTGSIQVVELVVDGLEDR
jgi:hypothetical protein